MQFVGKCMAWKATNGTENLLLQALQFCKRGVCHELPGGQA